MRTRRSPRNQELLWRILGGSAKPRRDRSRFLRQVARTIGREQILTCGHSRELPPMWAGRPPAQRYCPECEAQS